MFDTASLFDTNFDWPFHSGDHNWHNRKRSLDPRVMMNLMMFPSSDYGYCEPEQLREVPIRYQRRPESMPRETLHHQRSATRSNSQTNHHPGASFQKHHQQPETTVSQSGPVPRKYGNMWEIPVQYVGQNNGPQTYQQSHENPQNQSPVHQPQGRVSIPVVHEVKGPATHVSSSRASSEPANPFTKPIPNSLDTGAQIHQKPQLECQCLQEQTPNDNQEFEQSDQQMPTSSAIPVNKPKSEQLEEQVSMAAPTQDDNKPEFEQSEQKIPSSSEQQDIQQPSCSPEKSLEEKAYEIINAILSEVKGLEEHVKSFKGGKKDKEYRYLEEMLTRSLLKLDSVESGSNEAVRQSRKQAVKYIEAAINVLELGALVSNVKSNCADCLESQQSKSEINEESRSECVVSSQGEGVDVSKVEMDVDTLE